MKKFVWCTIFCSLFLGIQAQRHDLKSPDSKALLEAILTQSFKADSLNTSKAINRLLSSELKNTYEAKFYAAFGTWQMVIGQPSLRRNDVKSIAMCLEALQLSEEAMALSPNRVEPYALATNIYYVLYYLQPHEIGKMVKETLRLRSMAKKLNEHHPFVLLTEAQNTYNAPKKAGGGQEKAIALYKKSIDAFKVDYENHSRLEPKWGLELAYAWTANAFLTKTTSEPKKALNYAQKALEARPQFTWVRSALLPNAEKAVRNE